MLHQLSIQIYVSGFLLLSYNLLGVITRIYIPYGIWLLMCPLSFLFLFLAWLPYFSVVCICVAQCFGSRLCSNTSTPWGFCPLLIHLCVVEECIQCSASSDICFGFYFLQCYSEFPCICAEFSGRPRLTLYFYGSLTYKICD